MYYTVHVLSYMLEPVIFKLGCQKKATRYLKGEGIAENAGDEIKAADH